MQKGRKGGRHGFEQRARSAFFALFYSLRHLRWANALVGIYCDLAFASEGSGVDFGSEITERQGFLACRLAF